MRLLSKREMRKARKLTAKIERHRLLWWAAAMAGDESAMSRHDAKAGGGLAQLDALGKPVKL